MASLKEWLAKALGLKRRFTLTQPERWTELAPATKAGTIVSEESALKFSAVLACVRIISESIAQLPLILYRRVGDRRERATDHPLYRLLHDAPNPLMTSFEAREYLAVSVLLWGNGYALIDRAYDGTPIALWPIHPSQVVVKVEDGKVVYELYNGKTSERLARSRVLHIRGLSLDGITGLSPIGLAKEAIGVGLAAEEAAARFWAAGGTPRELLKVPGITDPEQWKQWRDAVERIRGGLEGSHRVQVLPAEWSTDKIGIPPSDAEFIETRNFQILEIARIFRVPPHKLGILEKASYASIEQQSIEFVQDSLLPWLRRFEQAIRRDVLPPWEPDLFVEHLVDGLLRGDIESRYRAYATARQWGWLSVNDIRRLENMEPIPGGDSYLMPLNMMPVNPGGNGGNDAGN